MPQSNYFHSFRFTSLIFFFSFLSSFSLCTLFSNRKKIHILSLCHILISSISRDYQSSSINIFSWMYLVSILPSILVFHFFLFATLHCILSNLVQFYCSLCAFPLTVCQPYTDCNIAIKSQQHYSKIMSDHSHAVVISDIPHFWYNYLWCTVAKAQSYIKKNA